MPEEPQEQLIPENSSVEIRQIQPKKEDVRNRLPLHLRFFRRTFKR